MYTFNGLAHFFAVITLDGLDIKYEKEREREGVQHSLSSKRKKIYEEKKKKKCTLPCCHVIRQYERKSLVLVKDAEKDDWVVQDEFVPFILGRKKGKT